MSGSRLRTCLGVEENKEVCEVNLRGEWSYLAGSASGWE